MPKIVDRAEMQERVLNGAMKAFLANGYHASTIAEIAEAAGLGKGTLYLYFDNKDAIAEAMVERYFAEMGDRFRADAQPRSLRAFLGRLSRSMDVSEDHAGFIRVFFEVFGPSLASDGFSKKISSFFDDLGEHYAATLEQLKDAGEVRPDIDTKAAGRVLASLIDGIMLHTGLFGIHGKRNVALKQEAIHLLTRGLYTA